MPPGGRGRGRGQGSWGPPGGEMTFSIPTHKCGLVIGRGESAPAFLPRKRPVPTRRHHLSLPPRPQGVRT